MKNQAKTENDTIVLPKQAVRSNLSLAIEFIKQQEHPILSKKLILPTKPINELVTALRRAVTLREQGCCFSATSGFGKSFGLALAEQELKRIFPGVAVFRHIIDNQQVPSIRAFFKHFLITVGVTDIKGETYDLRVRLINRLVERGRSSRMKLVVLLVDEAQGMALQDFRFLKDIGNELEKVDVQLVVIMMGQDPDFGEAIDRLRDEGRLDLVSRFTLRQLKFRGLQTADDFESLLELIDKQYYPATSMCTWPQFFAPRAWNAGFRMKNQTSALMKAIDNQLPDVLAKKGVPARQLFLAIKRFLFDLADVDASDATSIPNDLWNSAIEYSLIEEASQIAKNDASKRNKRVKVKA